MSAVSTPPEARRYTIHVVSKHTLSEPSHTFLPLLAGMQLRQVAQVARVLSIFPSVYRTVIRVDDGSPEVIAQEFPGVYVHGEYRNWQREGSL